MNEKLDLVEILKGCPVGTKLYSTVHGESEFRGIVEGEEPIATRCCSAKGAMGKFYTTDGRVTPNSLGECVLFPSKTQRDWSKFKAPIKKFDPTTLHPFDKVLVKVDTTLCTWKCVLFSHIDKNKQAEYSCSGLNYKYCIPYNDDTKHLLGTSDEAPEYYKYWED